MRIFFVYFPPYKKYMHVRDPPLRGACFVPRFSLRERGVDIV